MRLLRQSEKEIVKGVIIIWSDETTIFFGMIVATDKEKGGIVVISSKDNLILDDKKIDVDLTSLDGIKRQLLLDPSNITLPNSSQDIQGDSTHWDLEVYVN